MRTKMYLGVFILLILSMGCTLPAAATASQPAAAGADEGTPPPEAVATLVQATLQALAPTLSSSTPAPTQPLASPTPTSTPTMTPTITPTYAPPMLVLDGNTNCRYGPGSEYQVMQVLQAGWVVPALGRYAENWWVVQAPDGRICWAAGDYAHTQGSVHLLPTATLPPTATPTRPIQPTGLHYYYTCQVGGSVDVELTWLDNAVNESGYRIYRDGKVIAELRAGVTLYNDVLPSEGSFVYEIAAFNVSGEAKTRMTAEINCH